MTPAAIVKTVLLSAMGAGALALLIRGPRPHTVEGLPAGTVVVDYWEKWTDAEGAQLRAMVDEFNDSVGKQKHIYVRVVTTSSIDKKTLVAIAGGVPPDLSGMWDPQLTQFAALGALMPLDEFAAAHGITAATYKKVYWDACHYDGHLYALISTPCTVALVYNRAAFKASAASLRAAGLDPDRPPRTLDEVDRYAAALDRRDAAGHLVRSGFLPAASWYINLEPWWFGGDIWDAKAKRFTLTSPASVAAYKWVQSYSKRMGGGAVAEFKTGMGNFDSPQNPFMAGTEVMEQQGPWMANFILNLKPSMAGVASAAAYEQLMRQGLPAAERQAMCDWAAAPFPSAVPGLEGVTYAGFDTLCIPKGAKHPAEAFEFMAWLTEQPHMEKLCNLHSKNSPLRIVSDNFLQHHKNPYIKVWDDLARSPNAHGPPPCPIWPEAADEINAVVQRLVLNPDLPVEPELAAMQGRLQAKYDTFAAHQAARHGSR